MDLTHNPEFTTMEAYRAYSDLDGMKALAQGVIKAANAAVGNPEVIEYQVSRSICRASGRASYDRYRFRGFGFRGHHRHAG